MGNTLKKRIYKFDNVKFIAILFVVVGHCIEGYVDKNTSDMFNSLYIFIYSFHMPLFIFLFGLFTKRQTKESKFDVNKFTFFIFLGFLLKAYRVIIGKITHSSPNFGVLGTSSIEWFLFVIAFYMLVCYLIRQVHPGIIIPVTIVLGCLIGFVNFQDISIIVHKSQDFLYLGRFFVFMPFFFIGYYLTPEKILNFTSKLYVRIPAIICFIAYFILCFRELPLVFQFKKLFTGRNPYSLVKIDNCCVQHRLIAYIISAILVLGIICILPNKKIPLISSMGQNTLSVYFWHNPIISLVKYLGLFSLFESLGDPLWKTLVFVFAIALTLILSTKICSYPINKLSEIFSLLHKEICYMLLIIIVAASLFVFYLV